MASYPDDSCPMLAEINYLFLLNYNIFVHLALSFYTYYVQTIISTLLHTISATLLHTIISTLLLLYPNYYVYTSYEGVSDMSSAHSYKKSEIENRMLVEY